jgi:hypothetical protein
MMLNHSNNFNTNIFETLIGSLNLAPIKISGQYKIIVALDGQLYLDDYAGRRVGLNKNEKFLPQVANFLNTPTVINDISILRYGAFQHSINKYYHIPFYLGANETDKKYPEFYVLSRVINETISDCDSLYQYGRVQQVYNLKDVGLYKIFDEILAEEYFEFPLYFNWEENHIKLYGYDIYKNTPAVNKFNILDFQSNQPYLDVLNNRILNNYVNNGMFFPRFLNIEFEFQYINNYTHFHNFYGFLGFGKEILPVDIKENKFTVKTKNFTRKPIDWVQEFYAIPEKLDISLNDYLNIIASGSIQPLTGKKPQVRFQTAKVDVNDSIIIKYANGDIEFEYVIKETDIIKTSLFQTMINVCREATTLSNYRYLFSATKNVKNSSIIIKIIWNDVDVLDEEFTLELPTHYSILDRFENSENYYKFRGIKLTDVQIPGQPNLVDNINNVLIDGSIYQIIEKFKFDDKTIIRLSEIHGLTKITEIEIFETLQEKLIELEPIPYLTYNSNLKCLIPFEQEKYVENLMDKFVNASGVLPEDSAVALASIESFNQRKFEPLHQYIKDDMEKLELDDSDIVLSNDSNIERVLNMLFNNGSTTYLTPQILNIDKQFYIQNGNVDIAKLVDDNLRYNWFLIKNECPDYLKSDIRSLRYFTDKPQITSRLIKINDSFCETVFLGVKYRLPIKYENFKFATYLNFNNPLDIETTYSFDINKSERTLYLVINKYLDFSDLIRGGNENNEPLLDLSFFHNAISSFNTTSTNFENFKTSGILLAPTENREIFFGTQAVTNWKHFHDGKYYIALFNEAVGDTNDFKLLFPTSGNSTLYVYSNIVYQGNVYNFISMTITVESIKYLESDYLWCEDVKIKFFDTEKIFLYRYNEVDNIEEILYVPKENIIDLIPKNANIFGDYIKIGTLFVNDQNETFEFLLPDKILSFKESWFEITNAIGSDGGGNDYNEKTLFKFPEFFMVDKTDEEIIQQFDTNPDNTVNYQINLFNVNQVWMSIRDIVRVDLKFKEMFETQVKKYLNTFMLTNLIDFTEINAAKINNTIDEYINFSVDDIDRNIAIWKILEEKKVVLLNRYSGTYFPFMPICPTAIEFQLPNYKQNQTLFNIYDKDFGGKGVSATGLWSEVRGNVVSSLFCKHEDIELSSLYSEKVNYKDLMIQFLNINDCIITEKNVNYLQKINKNVDEYILETYATWLIENFYTFDNVINQNGEKINFQIDSRNKYIVLFNEKATTKLTFIFKRK